ncbi:N-alpha-acetyltransferase 15, NatA auxiliary subunit [Lunasporangiospora selenospora]|uniref:N-alpha-acetyltransferase 15, NatA auxiliary subunit n=1 Tax=Lunasporangiospora selenospora TaxID=979761 RepID=A0A9P6G1J6_9FUNG|nr:N-alpha-acetyltransferase 15, NatA auxiliary subunit [Lunasporangiospora selenospora]
MLTHFNDFTEDQFDFHMYCLRKMTLRAYISLLKLEDQLRSHPYYFRAAQNAIRCYVQLFDKPDGSEPEEMEGMTEAEKKKYRSKLRKAELKAQKEAEEKKQQAKEEMAKKGGKIDEDPEGLKYSKTEDPLEAALKFLRPLQELASERIETHLMGFEIYIRKSMYLLGFRGNGLKIKWTERLTARWFGSDEIIDKLLLALKSLLKSVALDANHATLHEQLVRFALAVEKAGSSIKPAVKTVIDQHLSTLYGAKANPRTKEGLEAFTTEFLNKNKDLGSVPHLISAAISISLIGQPSAEKSKAKAEGILFLVEDQGKYGASCSLENCLLIQKTLKSLRSSRQAEFKQKAAVWFPKATAFQS